MPLEVLGDEVLVRSVPGAETLSPADSAVPTSDMRNCVSDMREREPEDAQGPHKLGSWERVRVLGGCFPPLCHSHRHLLEYIHSPKVSSSACLAV